MSSELSTRTENLGYDEFQATLRRLQNAVSHLSERAAILRRGMRANSRSADGLADLCAAAEVSKPHLARIGDVAGAFGHVATRGLRVAGAADRVRTGVGNVRAAHRAECGGIKEADAVSPGPMAKPGWYRQSG